MPSKGSGWRWYAVSVVDSDGTTREVEITATCNGTTAYASYVYIDQQGYHYPDGSLNSSETIPFAGPCDEITLKQWAVDNYAQRVRGVL